MFIFFISEQVNASLSRTNDHRAETYTISHLDGVHVSFIYLDQFYFIQKQLPLVCPKECFTFSSLNRTMIVLTKWKQA